MLKRLEIKNYALITDLNLELSDGLTILTGETGAGKSIIMGALSLLLGERADTKVISDGSKKSLVEATFTDVSDQLKNIMEDNELDWNEGELIIRREIASSGRSRAFVNDSPVNLSLLNAITSRLIDIHSQHNNTKLSEPEHQREIIDSLADDSKALDNYRHEFREFIALRNKIKKLREQISKARENQEFLKFQKEQLDKLAPNTGELQQIEKKYDILSDADEIRENLSETLSLFRYSDTGILDRLSEARGLLEKIDTSYFDKDGATSVKTRLEDALIELKDLAETLEDFSSEVESDPVTLSKISTRMNAYYDLIKRFRVKDGDELVELQKDINNQLQSIKVGGGNLAELEKEGKLLARSLKEKADILTEQRRKTAKKFSDSLNDIARPLGLRNMRFDVSIEEGKLTSEGQDKIEFLCAFNKNQSLKPISKVASGGEISRLMLSMKRILTDKMELPTVIFDEIDTGVSGEIADKMGEMMKEMSNRLQVLTITHLPQVAAKGMSHLKVYKKDDEHRTVTNIKYLSSEERVQEIAGMLSGSELDNAAITNARALLEKSGN